MTNARGGAAYQTFFVPVVHANPASGASRTSEVNVAMRAVQPVKRRIRQIGKGKQFILGVHF
jgi:hypothetical protein